MRWKRVSSDRNWNGILWRDIGKVCIGKNNEGHLALETEVVPQVGWHDTKEAVVIQKLGLK